MYTLAWILVGITGVYAAIGIGFALFFVVRGVGRIDPAAAEGTVGFRVLILPGVAALWPLLMRRYQEGSRPPRESNAHRDAVRSEAREATRPVAGDGK
jgi:hypothetical protein